MLRFIACLLLFVFSFLAATRVKIGTGNFASAHALTGYEANSASVTVTGPTGCATTSVAARWSVIGTVVCIYFEPVQCTAEGAGTFTLASPGDHLNPSLGTWMFYNFVQPVEVNGALTMGILQYMGGSWNVYGSTAGGNFGTSGNQGWNRIIGACYNTDN